MTELNWGNLQKFFDWVREHGHGKPYVDDEFDGEMTIDGAISRDDCERFMAAQPSLLACEHEWVDVSIYEVLARKREICRKCGSRRIVEE